MDALLQLLPVSWAVIVAAAVIVFLLLRRASASSAMDMTQVGTGKPAMPPSFHTRPLQADAEWVNEHAGMATALGAKPEQIIHIRDLIAGRVGLPGGALRGDDTLGDLCHASGRDPVAMLREMVAGSGLELRDTHIAKAARLKVKFLVMLAVAGEKFKSNNEYNFDLPED
jgi:hypothetical protein